MDRHFVGRVPLPLLIAGTKIDCAPPAREWTPTTLNLKSPVSEKERNIADWLRYTDSILQSFMGAQGAVSPCASGASSDDSANQYGIRIVRQRIFETLPEATRTLFARLTRDRQHIDRRAENIVRLFSSMAGTAAILPFCPMCPTQR